MSDQRAGDKSVRLVAVADGRAGCPVTRWDGPYSFRCGHGVDECSIHGKFETREEPTDV